MTKHDWLVLRFEAPLLAFGNVRIDNLGSTRNFPALSMLTGLIANALGWQRKDKEKHQKLQERIIVGARHGGGKDHSDVLTDTQNAQLERKDRGWTTYGIPEGRDGASFGGAHRRRRDYLMDAQLIVVLRLEPANLKPDLDDIGNAFDRPARPLFIGRKPCLPASPLVHYNRLIKAPDAYTALAAVEGDQSCPMRATWPVGSGPDSGETVTRVIDLPDLFNWKTGLHGGTRRVVEGHVTPKEKTA